MQAMLGRLSPLVAGPKQGTTDGVTFLKGFEHMRPRSATRVVSFVKSDAWDYSLNGMMSPNNSAAGTRFVHVVGLWLF